MAILRAYLARLIVLGETPPELPNSRTDRPLHYASGLPLAGAAPAFCLRLHPNSTPHGRGRGTPLFRP